MALYDRALTIEPHNTDVLVNYGYALLADSQEERAAKYLEKTLAQSPDRADVHYRLGVQLGHLGQKAGSITHLQKAIDLDPGLAEAYRSLSEQIMFTADMPIIETMQSMIDAKAATAQTRLHLGFALGKALEDCKVYKSAFKYLRFGDQEKRQLLDYRHEDTVRQFQSLKDAFTVSEINRLKTKPSCGQQMIFVVGMNRSGTSLVEHILATHDDVFGAGELETVTQFLFANIDRISDMSAGEVSQFAQSYLDEIEKLANGRAPIVDKLPANYHAVGLIKTAFPAAKIIRLDRDIRDNCLSIYKTYFDTQAHALGYDLEELAKCWIFTKPNAW